ncbi:hypothetical protein F7R91_05665 [Streptomyces luteolifulvus]|uniref:Uncharacterized protein n=1 Tax=Streptomyces luteolifulvus TaxID=2615112 RepID=A0A6H9V9C7_9ACTN|nr:hypothetical protein [Streptomyces luteolifulvus]KAB1149246.1 hypothetical protein F7R91_05665 [Streptomyces luteolifulvus]
MKQNSPDAATVVRLAISESQGAIPGGWREDTVGKAVQMADWGTVCPGCDKVPAAGQRITKIFHAWWHASCGAAYLKSTAADEAWLALGHQLERRPSGFNNSETKAIVRNLLRIAGRSFTIPEQGWGDSVHGRQVAVKSAGDEATQFADVIEGYDDNDLQAAVTQAEQLNPGASAAVVGLKAWSQLDSQQQDQRLPELLAAYVELARIQADL